MSFKKVYFEKLLVYILIAEAVWFVSSFVSQIGYNSVIKLNRPSFMVPVTIYPAIWIIMYAIIGVSAFLVSQTEYEYKEKHKPLFLYGLHLGFNFLFNIFYFAFNWRFFSVIWLITTIYIVLCFSKEFNKLQSLSGKLLIPYIMWLFYLLYLNIGFWFLNRW